MTITQDVFWIMLPNGVRADADKQYLRLSVFINPRLRSDEGMTLCHYADFLDWGALMQHDRAAFAVRLDDGTEVPANIVSGSPDAAIWRTLFHPDIPVRPYRFEDESNRPLVSFPASKILNYLKSCYKRLAVHSPHDLPLVRGQSDDQVSLGSTFDALGILHYPYSDDRRLFQARLRSVLEKSRKEARSRSALGAIGGAAILPAPERENQPEQIEDAFFNAALFHYRPSSGEPVDLPKDEAARTNFEETFDFHQMVSALGDYPQLLRRLGLIIDLEVDADKIPLSDEMAPHSLTVVPSWRSALPRKALGLASWTADYCPRTKFVHRKQNEEWLFAAASATGEFYAGLWTPGQETALEQIDVDGAALKTLQLMETLGRPKRPEDTAAIDAPERAGVPTLRTGGISIVRSGNANRRFDSFVRSAKLDQSFATDPPVIAELYAEDLMRGYRFDVFEERTGAWRSLHGRIGTYATPVSPGAVPGEIADEGFAQASVTRPARADDTPRDPGEEIYVHETLFTWDGWSLSAPRPGLSISRSSRAPDPDHPESMSLQVENTAMTRLGLETTFMVQPGSLPRLRFGHGYRVRLRAVDLAGNSPTLEEATAVETALPPAHPSFSRDHAMLYRRFEPVSPPELVPRQLYSPDGNVDQPGATAYAEGESLERLVIRSNYDISAEEYAALFTAYQSFNDRHVAAPKASLQLIEAHGLLDAALDAKQSGLSEADKAKLIRKVYDLALMESGSWNDRKLPSVRFVRTGKEADSTEGYAIHTELQAVLPYLPDPWSAGVAFQGLPGLQPEESFKIVFDGSSWDKPQPFILRLAEGEGAPEWDEAARVLTAKLPKGGIVRVKVSSIFGGELDGMGIWQWLREEEKEGRLASNRLSEFKQEIQDGRHWLFTPAREITLVHATQQPLLAPDLQLSAYRDEGETVAWLNGEIRLHASSTAKIDIEAKWTEPIDDPARKLKEDDRHASAHVMEIPTVLDDGSELKVDYSDIVPGPLFLTKGKILAFRAKQAADALRWHQEVLELLPNSEENKQKIRYHRNQINLAGKITAHAFGDTKYRRVSYNVSATSRFREYFRTDTAAEKLHRSSGEFVLDIPSTARPAAPRVLYALPMFGWETETDPDGTTRSKRIGGGIRVYLDRPWWSSGDGELLGVVLTSSLPGPLEPLTNYATQWGQDPIWQSPGLPLPRPEDFKNCQALFKEVKLAELDDTYVDVAVYPVHWDAKRELWYSDLELETAGAYFPFIRLALARFQPHSLMDETRGPGQRMAFDLRLSNTLLADFVQTAPDRICSVTRGAAQGSYDIAISGVTYAARRSSYDNAVIQASSQVEVIAQWRDITIEDETVGWSDLPLIVTLAAGVPNEHGVVVWSGGIHIPLDYQGKRLRLVVQEFERLDAASAIMENDGTRPRSVYTDIIPL